MAIPNGISPRGFDQVLQLRFKLYLPSIIGLPTLAVYDTVRSFAWRQEGFGPEGLAEYVADRTLVASPSYKDIHHVTGIGYGRVPEHVRRLEQLGWVRREARKTSAGATTSPVYILGEMIPDLGGGTETLYADVEMDRWYSEVDALAQQQTGQPFRKMPVEERVPLVRSYFQKAYPDTLSGGGSRGPKAPPTPNGVGDHPQRGWAISRAETEVQVSETPSEGTGSRERKSPMISGTSQGTTPNGGGGPPPMGVGGSPENPGKSPKSLAKKMSRELHIHNSHTELSERSLRTSYSEITQTFVQDSGLTLNSNPLTLNSDSDPELRTTPTTHPVALAPPAAPEARVACVIPLPVPVGSAGHSEGDKAMAFRRQDSGSGRDGEVEYGQWGSKRVSGATGAVSAPKPPPLGLGRSVEQDAPVAPVVPPPVAVVPEPVAKPRPVKAVEAVQQLTSVVDRAKEESRAATEAALKKDRAKKQKRDNLKSDKGYAAQRNAAQQIEQVWREEMGEAFPDLPQIAWFKREGFKLVARKEGKLAADLLDGYGGDVDVVSALVQSYIRNWSYFGPLLTKQDDGVPTFGLLYACHASVAAEGTRLAKRNAVIAQYEEWRKANVGNDFAVPPAELEAAYRAATAGPRGKR